MNNNDDFNPMNALNVFGLYLGLQNYVLNLKQTTNDDLLKELKMQDEKYLMKIMEQNEKIIRLLKENK